MRWPHEEVCKEFTEKEPGTLDYFISDEEFDAETSKLKTNEAPGVNYIFKWGVKIQVRPIEQTFDKAI